jgi:endo-1,4-beta-xylanase
MLLPAALPSPTAFLALCLLAFECVHAAAPANPLPLWPEGAPGSAARRQEPEKVTGSNVSNIHHPSLTAYWPEAPAPGGPAVIIAPGGGHARLAAQHEGHNVALWLARHGVAAFVLKYRLAKDDATPAGQPQPYSVDRDALADARRALRLVRSGAGGPVPGSVGILGFSAGGEVALLAATRPDEARPGAADPLERSPARADFYALVYPGGLTRPDLEITGRTPPVFLTAGYQDRANISEGLAEFYLRSKRAGASAELHLYAGAGHGFGIRETNRGPHAAWPERLLEWLAERKFLPAAPRPNG